LEHFEGIKTYTVKHLPIVKVYADRLGLVKLINHLVPSEMDLEPGLYFLGMVLNTLSGRNPLYRLEHFFEDQDTELLLGRKVDGKSFNDINVGRFIDKVFDVGVVKIFKAISMRAVSGFGLNCRHVHFDTTSRSVYGEYEPYGNDPFEITYGYSKDHRPDLKQFLISMLCVDRNVLVFGKIEDGNASDKRVNNDVLSEISKYMAIHGLGAGAFIYIADSAAVADTMAVMAAWVMAAGPEEVLEHPIYVSMVKTLRFPVWWPVSIYLARGWWWPLIRKIRFPSMVWVHIGIGRIRK
jgi:transposase